MGIKITVNEIGNERWKYSLKIAGNHDSAVLLKSNNLNDGNITLNINAGSSSFAGGSIVTLTSDKNSFLNNEQYIEVEVWNTKAELILFIQT